MLKRVYPVNKLLNKFSGLSVEIEELRASIRTLQQQVIRQEKMLELLAQEPGNSWLYSNRQERMDANSEVFDLARRRFHLARYEFAANYCRDKVILDLACGTGYGSRMLADLGQAKTVLGMDIDESAINYASERYGSQSVRFLVGDGENTGLSDVEFDVIVSFETIEHVPNDLRLLSEFARLIKTGGHLICSTPNAWPIDLSEHHLREYNLQSFKSVLSKEFEVINLFNQNSGCDIKYNHDQPAGITPTTQENHSLAECLIAVCRRK